MTRSHAKNASTGSVFTSHERQLLRTPGGGVSGPSSSSAYGLQRMRVGGDSFRALDGCVLCLSSVTSGAASAASPSASTSTAASNDATSEHGGAGGSNSNGNGANANIGEGVSCNSGHIYCRECLLSSLLLQKRQSLRAREEEKIKREEEEKREEDRREEARKRVVKDFEGGLGLAGPSRTNVGAGAGATRDSTNGKVDEGAGGMKRKRQGDHEGQGEGQVQQPKSSTMMERIDKLARKAQEDAMERIEREKAEARKSKLPAFWLPSLTPDAAFNHSSSSSASHDQPPVAPSLSSSETFCNAGGLPHPISLKTILPVKFTYPPHQRAGGNGNNARGKRRPICPSCSKELSNSSSAYILSAKLPSKKPKKEETKGKKDGKERAERPDPKCGHVVCATCVETIVIPSGACVVCEAKIRPNTGEKTKKEMDSKDLVEIRKEGTGYAAMGGAEVTKNVGSFLV